MKIFTLILFLTPFAINAQIQLQEKSTIKSQSHEKSNSGKYYSEYVVKPEKLKTFFHTNSIPESFPKYNKYLTFEENKLIAIEWAKINKQLIKEEYWYKFEDKN